MDPLSITAAVVSFVDIARRIKDSVDKVGQTRQNLQQFTENLVEELTELQILCQDGQGRLNHIDTDSIRSLQKLHSDLVNVLELCLTLAERRRSKKSFSSVKYYVIAWLKNAEIEGHILRLRDRVSSVHRRFAMVASLRAERVDNELLVATSEMRAKMNRMESLLSPLFIASHGSGAYPASALDRDDLDVFDYQFLHRQVQRTATLLGRLVATHTFIIKESRGPVSFGFPFEHHRPSRTSLMRSTTIEVLETLQLLELEPSSLALWEGAQHLTDLGNYLVDLDLEEDAVVLCTAITTVYRTLMHGDPGVYLPYVVWGLQCLASVQFGTREGLDAAKRAVDVCRETAVILQEEYCVFLAHSLRVYSGHLTENGRFDEAVACGAEALAMQRRAPPSQQDPDCLLVSWEACGEEHVSLTSERTIFRPFQTAVDDMFCLGLYAQVLSSVGRWSEAWIIATEAVQCVDALGRCDPWAEDLLHWFVEVHEEHQYIFSRIFSPHPPLATVISDIDDADDLYHEFCFGGCGSGAQSTLLVRT